MFINILIFIASCVLLTVAGKWLVGLISRVAISLKMKEFVLAFFLVAIGTTLPNIIVGIVAAINKIPELSFGDVVGSNVFDISIVIGLAALLSQGGLSAQSRTVQSSSVFTLVIALLPIALVSDGILSRIDGLFLLLSFAFYTFWMFSKKDRFTKTCEDVGGGRSALKKDLFFIFLGLVLLLAGGQGIVMSAMFFSKTLNVAVGIIGIFAVAIGTCMPETFFSLHAARNRGDWMILGTQMGNVVVTSTMVLGIVSLIHPINVGNFAPFAVTRIFLFISMVLFFIFLKTNQKITKNEGLILIGVYVLFLITEIFVIRRLG